MGPVPLQPARADTAQAAVPTNPAIGQGALAERPPGQNFTCIAVSNDFLQYWLGAYLPITIEPAHRRCSRPGPSAHVVRAQRGRLGGQPGQAVLAADDVEHPRPGHVPAVHERSAIKVDGPPAFDPPNGTQYVYSQQADSSYKRLTHTVDLTGKTRAPEVQDVLRHRAGLRLRVRRGPHGRPGRLDDAARRERNTRQDPGSAVLTTTRSGCTSTRSCATTSPAGTPGGSSARRHGTTGAWNAATGNSGGFQDWNVDLTLVRRQEGRGVDHVREDPATQGLGVFVDDAKITSTAPGRARRRSRTTSAAGTVPGRPRAAGPTPTTGSARRPSGSSTGPASRTDHSIYWGFGLEGVTGARQPRNAHQATRCDTSASTSAARTATFEGPPPGGPRRRALGGAAVRGALDRGAGQKARADELALALVRRPHRGSDAVRPRARVRPGALQAATCRRSPERGKTARIEAVARSAPAGPRASRVKVSKRKARKRVKRPSAALDSALTRARHGDRRRGDLAPRK